MLRGTVAGRPGGQVGRRARKVGQVVDGANALLQRLHTKVGRPTGGIVVEEEGADLVVLDDYRAYG